MSKANVSQLDKWVKKGWTELEWLNEVKPLIISGIKMLIENGDTLETIKTKYSKEKGKKKKEAILSVVQYLTEIKARADKNDVVAKMILANHGFMVRKEKEKK